MTHSSRLKDSRQLAELLRMEGVTADWFVAPRAAQSSRLFAWIRRLAGTPSSDPIVLVGPTELAPTNERGGTTVGGAEGVGVRPKLRRAVVAQR